MIWTLTDKGDQRVRRIADRHYSRGSPGDPQFCRPGRNLVLRASGPGGDAAWVTWAGIQDHAWPGTWECTLFRNEGAGLSSALIIDALAASRWAWGDPPAEGMITFVDAARVRSSNPGFCFMRAGFRRLRERTKDRGRAVLMLEPRGFPPPAAPILGQGTLFE